MYYTYQGRSVRDEGNYKLLFSAPKALAGTSRWKLEFKHMRISVLASHIHVVSPYTGQSRVQNY